MAKGISIKIGNTEHWMVYNAEMYFDIIELMGEDIYNKINEYSKSGWDTTVKAAVMLLEAGELCRRYMGYDPKPFVTEAELRLIVEIEDVLYFKGKVLDAMYKGSFREVPDESPGEIDVGLQELEKKTKLR